MSKSLMFFLSKIGCAEFPYHFWALNVQEFVPDDSSNIECGNDHNSRHCFYYMWYYALHFVYLLIQHFFVIVHFRINTTPMIIDTLAYSGIKTITPCAILFCCFVRCCFSVLWPVCSLHKQLKTLQSGHQVMFSIDP